MPLAKRRLTDLFILGRELVLDDGFSEEGPDGQVIEYEPVRVWVQKMNPVEQAEASRHADAARARYLAVKRQPESEEYQQQVGAVLQWGNDPETLIPYVLGDERVRLRQVASQRVSAEPEWDKDNYLQGLYDSWNTGGYKEKWLSTTEGERDPEVQRVFDELERYNKAVEDAVEDEMEPLIDAKRALPLTELQELMVDRMIDLDAGQQWLEEYARWQMCLCVRDPDNHKKRYFESREEVNEIQGEVYKRLRDVFQLIDVEASEGKSSPGPLPSSPSSEPSDTEETAEPSGQLVSSR